MVNFTFRIPDDLYADLKTLAAGQDRSVNSELLHLVRQAVGDGTTNRPDGDSSSPATLRGSGYSPRP
ncbi:CopG family ribbon-helix-helix protein [Streptomyces scopuliridis]|uniref:CopG family ribbon-helix-helix protein n=1 Tax=Streptomyces scopuliridis TaxID=452529 RepID=UPI0036CEBCD6